MNPEYPKQSSFRNLDGPPTLSAKSSVATTRFSKVDNQVEITVVTITNRPENLEAVTHQVMRQDFSEMIEHVIVVDGMSISDHSIKTIFSQFDQTENRVAVIHFLKGQENRFLYEKLGMLRNFGILRARGAYVALWDDDNEWETDHLSSLYELVKNQPVPTLAHSWRTLMVENNEPYIIQKDQYPWTPQNSPHGKFMYQMLNKAGIITEGTNEYRDKHGYQASPKSDTLGSCVDTGEWLIPKKLFEDKKFLLNENYDYLLYHFGASDDPQFAFRLLQSKIPVVCSERFSMRYYMQGDTKVYRNQGG